MKKLLIYLMIICAGKIYAQSISGTVKDLNKNTRIYSALVEIVNLQSSTRDTVFTSSIGEWQFDIASTSVETKFIIPKSIFVSQNYPNPFNPSTRINFTVLKEGNVQISIHNILGQLIETKFALLQAGSYFVEWSGIGSAGVYFYTVKQGDNAVTKKMVLLDGGNGTGLSGIYAGSDNFRTDYKKVSSFNLQIIISKFSYVPDTMNVTVSGGENFNTFLETVHSHSRMIDLHNDILELIVDDPNYHLSDFHSYNHTDIPRLRLGGVDVQFFAVWVSPTGFPNNPFQRAGQMIDRFNVEMALNPNHIEQARNVPDVLNINGQGKIAAVLGVEGGHAIENSLAKLDSFYNAGVRYMTITWNNSTDWAVSAADSRSATVGLSNFGRQVIRTMDSLGIIIDVSHTGIKTIQDILEVTTNPIIASHSGARAVHDHYRNLYDSQIMDIANTGGVIGIVFYPPFLGSPSSSVDINTVIQHIDHIVNLAGIDYVAIGSDFDGIGTNTVNGLEDVSKFPALTSALLEHGYTQEEVEKILGKNFMRVFQQVCGNTAYYKPRAEILK